MRCRGIWKRDHYQARTERNGHILLIKYRTHCSTSFTINIFTVTTIKKLPQTKLEFPTNSYYLKKNETLWLEDTWTNEITWKYFSNVKKEFLTEWTKKYGLYFIEETQSKEKNVKTREAEVKREKRKVWGCASVVCPRLFPTRHEARHSHTERRFLATSSDKSGAHNRPANTIPHPSKRKPTF